MTLRVVLDEALSPTIAEGLRLRGLDAISIHEVNRTGRADEEQLIFAVNERRALITYNRHDFQALDAVWRVQGKHHCGIAWCGERIIPRRDIGGLVRAIVFLAVTHDTLDDICVPLTAP